MSAEPESNPPAPAGHIDGYVCLLDTLDGLIASCDRSDRRLALLVIDLSSLDMLVSKLGYRRINEILDYVQDRLSEIKRPSDVLTRVSAKRFALIIPDLKFNAMVELLVNKIVKTLDGLRFHTAMEATVYPKTGVAVYPDNGATAEQLLLGADTAAEAVYGTKNWLVHAGSTEQLRIGRLRDLEAELEKAFRQSCFELRYQPKVALETGRMYGAEALIRWNHPQHGLIAPDLFVPIMEKNFLLQEITLWILNTALHQSVSIRERYPDFTISVNLSPALLMNPELAELVVRALRIWNIPPPMLILEITETSAMVNQELSQRTLQRLSEHGILLSIDDFGTGYSSYSYLQQVPVHELKIDKSFINTLLHDSSSERLVSSMIRLGQDLGIAVLAEGIETVAVSRRLLELGCRYGQGYLFARPMPAAELLQWTVSPEGET